MLRILLSSFLLLVLATPVFAFMEEGCGAGSCIDCHSFDVPEAKQLLQGWGDDITRVELAEVPGMWVVDVVKEGKTYPIFVDFSKAYIFSGNIIKIENQENITRKQFFKANPVDPKNIPVEDALLLGNAKAKTRVIVFTDPQCPYCAKLHKELEKVVKADPSIAFLIKLFPLKMHPQAKGISESILCAKADPKRGPEVAMAMLETSFAKGEVPPATCTTAVVDKTIALAEELGIRSTPTLILPNGVIEPGMKDANRILKLLGSDKSVPENGGKE